MAEAAGATSPAPAALVAAPGATVTLSWGAAAGAAKYRVERSADGTWASPAVYSTAGAETTYQDGTASQGAAYLYRVCAADSANNCVSAYSNAALGAARSFTDPQIVTHADHQQGVNTHLPLTTIKAAHVLELREAVNSVRQLAGLPPADWGETNLQGLPVRAEHVRELRTKLGEALSQLGLPAPSYETLSEGVTVIKRDHFAQLRLAATRGAGTTSAGGGGATGGVRWLVTDHLGTPRMTADQTGSLAGIRRHDYFPFGEEIGAGVGGRTTTQGYSQTDGVRQSYTGAERDDETGLDFMRSRYYSGTQGRFTSPDVCWKDSQVGDPQSWNKYAYVRNNPLKYVDPTGEKATVKIETDEEKKTGKITVTATIALWTSRRSGLSQKDLQKAAQEYKSNIEKSWSGTYEQNGIKYEVSVTVDVQAFESRDAANNSFDGNVQNVLEVVPAGGNSFMRKASIFGGPDRGQIAVDAGTRKSEAAHEFTHLLGVNNRYLGAYLSNTYGEQRAQSATA